MSRRHILPILFVVSYSLGASPSNENPGEQLKSAADPYSLFNLQAKSPLTIGQPTHDRFTLFTPPTARLERLGKPQNLDPASTSDAYATKNTDRTSSATSSDVKDVVVISKNPEFFTYTLSTISVLLTIVVLTVGAFTGVGLSMVIRMHKDKVESDKLKLSFDKHQKELETKLLKNYENMLSVMKRTAFGTSKISQAKLDLRNLFAQGSIDSRKAYQALQKTISYPDLECLHLYAVALRKCEGNIDIIRIVRNGIDQYHRNPEANFGKHLEREDPKVGC